MLTGNADDMAAVLQGIREHRDTLVSALEGEPAAAASLVNNGVLDALQVRRMSLLVEKDKNVGI